MTKKIFMLFILIICFFNEGTFGEEKTSNKPITSESRAYVDVMNRRAADNLDGKFEKTLDYGKSALKIAEKLSYKKGQLIALKHIGLAYFYLSNYKNAMRHFKQMLEDSGTEPNILRADALRYIGSVDAVLGNYNKSLNSSLRAKNIYAVLGDKKGFFKTLNNMGNVFLKLGNYQKSHQYYFEAILIAKTFKDKRAIALLYNNIGNGYEQLKEYTKALEYYLKSYRLKKERNNRFDTANALQNIGWVYFKMDFPEKAVLYTEQSLKIKKEIKDNIGISEILNNLGEIYLNKNKYKKALKYFLNSLELKEKTGRKWSISYTKKNLALLYIEIKNYKKAEKYISEGLKESNELKALDLKKQFYYCYYSLYQLQRNYKKGIEYLELFHRTKEMIEKKNSKNRIIELETSIKFDEKVRELQENNVELKKQKTIKNFLFITTLLVLVISILVFSRYRYSMKTQLEIKNKNRSLKKAFKEIELMSRTDHLTTLSNRREIIQRIKTEKDRLQRNMNVFSIVMIDIDNFKKVNDSYGHNTGDYVLKSFADILKKNIRKQDVAARWGGEEFLLLLPETGIEGASKIAEKIREKVQSSVFEYKNNFMKITITSGVGDVKDFSLGIDDIISLVDEALYKGKKNGKNQIVSI